MQVRSISITIIECRFRNYDPVGGSIDFMISHLNRAMDETELLKADVFPTIGIDILVSISATGLNCSLLPKRNGLCKRTEVRKFRRFSQLAMCSRTHGGWKQVIR